jgi:hypothetical protein
MVTIDHEGVVRWCGILRDLSPSVYVRQLVGKRAGPVICEKFAGFPGLGPRNALASVNSDFDPRAARGYRFL